MRWQLPLVASFALVAAVGCDTQPMEPTDSQPTFALEDRAQVYADEVSWATTVCGVDIVDFTGTIRGLERTSADLIEDKMYQYMYLEHYNFVGIGRTTGYTWRAVNNYHEHVETTWDGKAEYEAPEIEMGIGVVKFIGQGQAPDFLGKGFYHRVTNANGDIVSTFHVRDWECD